MNNNAHGIRWAAWKALPSVQLWQAVLLSLGVEPTSELEESATSHEQSVVGARAWRRARGHVQLAAPPAEHWTRMRFCQNALSTEGPIRPQASLYRGMLQDPRCKVLLSEVADFLSSAEFSLPAEMLRKSVGETAVAAAAPVSAASASAIETPRQRRARLLQMHEAEVSADRERGALARITEIEKRTRPTADRSNIGKDIRKAREERDAERRGGAITRLLK